MYPLNVLRENGDAVQLEETLQLGAIAIQEGIRQWLQLQSAFEWQLQQTAPLFEQERRAALKELQARLQRLID
ncbi:MAG: hypothetical protein WAV05_03545 [Anaerolineales bacterium]